MKIQTRLHTVRCPVCRLLWEVEVTEKHYRRAVKRFSYPELTHHLCLCRVALVRQKDLEGQTTSESLIVSAPCDAISSNPNVKNVPSDVPDRTDGSCVR
jgi:hypothetical protein